MEQEGLDWCGMWEVGAEGGIGGGITNIEDFSKKETS